MENQKPDIRGEIHHFQNSDIKNCFPITYKNCPKHFVNELEKIQNTFSWKNSTPKIKH